MRGRKGIYLVLLFSLFIGVLAVPGRTEAKMVSVEGAANMYCDGRYVYYTGELTEPDMGLMRLDTKTGNMVLGMIRKQKHFGNGEKEMVDGL